MGLAERNGAARLCLSSNTVLKNLTNIGTGEMKQKSTQRDQAFLPLSLGLKSLLYIYFIALDFSISLHLWVSFSLHSKTLEGLPWWHSG